MEEISGLPIFDTHQQTCHKLALETEKVKELKEIIRQNHVWHQTFDEYDGYTDSELCELNLKGLSL